MKSIANSPAIKHGRTCEPYAISDFEGDHGKVTKTGLHISKAMPNFGNLNFVIIYYNLGCNQILSAIYFVNPLKVLTLIFIFTNFT